MRRINAKRQIGRAVGEALSAAALCAIPGLGGALAQTPAAQAGIEEIIVTAQRREESLQKTPIAITALTATDLDARTTFNLADVGAFVPNLDFTTATQSSRSSFVSAVFIRGVGQTDFIVTTDPAVGIYVDGVYYGRTTGGVVDMLDIERVEVLRGPQGTLFGKNTIGGALNIVSSPVGKDFAGTGEVTAGNYGRVNFRGDLNVPLTDTLGGRLAVSVKRSDGYGKRLDFATGKETSKLGEDDSTSARGRLHWAPSDKFDANLAVDVTRVREPQVPDHIESIDPTLGLLGLWNGLVGLPLGTPYTPQYLTGDKYTSYANGPNKAELDNWGASLNLQWGIGELTLRSITAYRSMQALFENDGDGSPVRILGTDKVDLDQDQVSQELHLLGKSFDDRLDWLAGLYYFHESANEFTHAYVMPGIFQSLEALPVLLGPAGPIGPCPPPDVVAALPTPGPLGCAGNPNNIPLDLDFAGTNDITVDNYSAFLHGTYEFTDAWSLSAGARYTHEKKKHDLVYGRVNSGYVIAPPGTVREDSWDVVTPKASLNYNFSDTAMAYVSASRGFRSGGYNGRPFYRDAITAFDPEYVWSYELGLKSEWLDRRLIANVALFYNDYTNMQLTANVATSDGNVAVITENAGEAEIKGFELELHARPVEQLDRIAGIGYTDAKFTKVDPGATVTEDSEFLKTPEWDINLGAEYRIPIGAASLAMRADYNWRSDYYNDTANTPGLHQDDVGILNARIMFESAGQAWQVALYGTNLTDERYITGGVGGAGAIGFDEAQYGRPLEYGVSVRYSF
jgi:iron complex outermembrane receptor protein